MLLCNPFVLGWWFYFLKEALLNGCRATGRLASSSLPEEWASPFIGLSLLCCMDRGGLAVAPSQHLG